MNLEKLKDYNYWVGQSPKEILNAVRQIKGGWEVVFPNKLPLWAHRVRNFFNREPKSFLRLEESQGKVFIRRIEAKRPPKQIPEKYALSDDVYKDAQNWVWYQMNEGGGIYHWGADPLFPRVEAAVQELKTWLRKPPPIFKFIAPDGTGGSRETILRNPHNLYTVVKKNNFLAYVANLIVTDDWEQGSYNYSETIVAGYDAHEKRDVIPHKENPFNNIYVNPPNRHSPLSERVFPEKANRDSNPLAKQINTSDLF
jgi:hypothetical protein